MTLPLLLSFYPESTAAIIVAVPAVPGRYRNIRTSGRTGTVYFALVPGVVDPSRDPPLDLWDGIPPGISSRRVTAAALVARKNFIAKSPADPSRNPQMMGVAQRGRLNFF